MKMHNPPHPGEVLKELCLEPLNLTVTEAAEALGVSRKTLSAILNGRAGISPEMAIRLGKAFDTSPESWLNQQMQYDLWQAEQTIGNISINAGKEAEVNLENLQYEKFQNGSYSFQMALHCVLKDNEAFLFFDWLSMR